MEPIRDATEYVGTRIRLHARLDNVRQTVQIDFGVGDAVHPQPQVIDYPVLGSSVLSRWCATPRDRKACTTASVAESATVPRALCKGEL